MTRWLACQKDNKLGKTMVTCLTRSTLTWVSSRVTRLYFLLGSRYSASVDTFMFCLPLVSLPFTIRVCIVLFQIWEGKTNNSSVTSSGLISPLPTVRSTFSDLEVLLNRAKTFLIIRNKNLGLRVVSLDLTANMFLDRNTKARWKLIAVFTPEDFLSDEFLV